LGWEWFIQPFLLIESLTRFSSGFLAQNRTAGIAWNDAGEHKGNKENAKDNGYGGQNAADTVLDHGIDYMKG
jgi:hypothetical protein